VAPGLAPRYIVPMTEAAASLDTHRMFKRLVGTGMPEPQAEVVVDLIRERQEQFVSRDVLRYELGALDERLGKRIDALERDVAARFDALERDVAARFEAFERNISARFEAAERDALDRDRALRQELGGRIDVLKQELGGRIDALEKRIERLEVRVETLGKDLTIRLGGMMAVGMTVVAALVAIF
jgi:chaperonin cofactor prefoldin